MNKLLPFQEPPLPNALDHETLEDWDRNSFTAESAAPSTEHDRVKMNAESRRKSLRFLPVAHMQASMRGSTEVVYKHHRR